MKHIPLYALSQAFSSGRRERRPAVREEELLEVLPFEYVIDDVYNLLSCISFAKLQKTSNVLTS